MKHALTALTSLALIVPAFAQQGPEEGDAPQTVREEVEVEEDGSGRRTGVVIRQEGDGPPEVLFLDGDELDALGLDLEAPGKSGAKMRLSFGAGGETFDFEFDGPPSPEQLKNVQEQVRARLKAAGIEHDFQLPALPHLDPKRRAELNAKAKVRAAERAEQARARLVGQLLDLLEAKDDERAALAPLLEAVLKQREASLQQRRAARKALLKAVRERDDLKSAAPELVRQHRAEHERSAAALTEARTALRSVLTLRQEAQLVARGLLE